MWIYKWKRHTIKYKRKSHQRVAWSLFCCHYNNNLCVRFLHLQEKKIRGWILKTHTNLSQILFFENSSSQKNKKWHTSVYFNNLKYILCDRTMKMNLKIKISISSISNNHRYFFQEKSEILPNEIAIMRTSKKILFYASGI